jgi:hypothetical protein
MYFEVFSKILGRASSSLLTRTSLSLSTPSTRYFTNEAQSHGGTTRGKKILSCVRPQQQQQQQHQLKIKSTCLLLESDCAVPIVNCRSRLVSIVQSYKSMNRYSHASAGAAVATSNNSRVRSNLSIQAIMVPPRPRIKIDLLPRLPQKPPVHARPFEYRHVKKIVTALEKGFKKVTLIEGQSPCIIKNFNANPNSPFGFDYSPKSGPDQPYVPLFEEGDIFLDGEIWIRLSNSNSPSLDDPNLVFWLSNSIQQIYCVPRALERIGDLLLSIIQQLEQARAAPQYQPRPLFLPAAYHPHGGRSIQSSPTPSFYGHPQQQMQPYGYEPQSQDYYQREAQYWQAPLYHAQQHTLSNNRRQGSSVGNGLVGQDRLFQQIDRGMENLSLENVNNGIRLDDNEKRVNRIHGDTEYLQIQACHHDLGIEELQERADRIEETSEDVMIEAHNNTLGINDLEERVDRIEETSEDVMIEAHNNTLGINDLEERADRSDGRHGHHETRLDTLDEETLGMRRQIKQHAGEIADTNEIIVYQDARLDTHDEQLHGIKEQTGGLEERLAKVETRQANNIPELDLGQALQVWKRLRLNPNQQSMELVEPFDRSTITVQVNMLEARGDEKNPELVVKMENGTIVLYVPLGPEGNKKLAALMNEMRPMAILDHTTKLLKMEQAISKKYYIVAIKDRMRAIDDRKRRQESEELRARRVHAP